MNKPKVKLTQEAQDMIDMFSELDEVKCNALAKCLLDGKYNEFGYLFATHLISWEHPD